MATLLLDPLMRRAENVRAIRRELSTPRVMSIATAMSRVSTATTVIQACSVISQCFFCIVF